MRFLVSVRFLVGFVLLGSGLLLCVMISIVGKEQVYGLISETNPSTQLAPNSAIIQHDNGFPKSNSVHLLSFSTKSSVIPHNSVPMVNTANTHDSASLQPIVRRSISKHALGDSALVSLLDLMLDESQSVPSNKQLPFYQPVKLVRANWFVFIRIQKTGSQTMWRNLVQQFDGKIWDASSCFEGKFCCNTNCAEILENEINKISYDSTGCKLMVRAHANLFDYENLVQHPADVKYYSLLRDPILRTLSEYRHITDGLELQGPDRYGKAWDYTFTGQSLQDWLLCSDCRHGSWNRMTRMLSGKSPTGVFVDSWGRDSYDGYVPISKPGSMQVTYGDLLESAVGKLSEMPCFGLLERFEDSLLMLRNLYPNQLGHLQHVFSSPHGNDIKTSNSSFVDDEPYIQLADLMDRYPDEEDGLRAISDRLKLLGYHDIGLDDIKLILSLNKLDIQLYSVASVLFEHKFRGLIAREPIQNRGNRFIGKQKEGATDYLYQRMVDMEDDFDEMNRAAHEIIDKRMNVNLAITSLAVKKGIINKELKIIYKHGTSRKPVMMGQISDDLFVNDLYPLDANHGGFGMESISGHGLYFGDMSVLFPKYLIWSDLVANDSNNVPNTLSPAISSLLTSIRSQVGRNARTSTHSFLKIALDDFDMNRRIQVAAASRIAFSTSYLPSIAALKRFKSMEMPMDLSSVPPLAMDYPGFVRIDGVRWATFDTIPDSNFIGIYYGASLAEALQKCDELPKCDSVLFSIRDGAAKLISEVVYAANMFYGGSSGDVSSMYIKLAITDRNDEKSFPALLSLMLGEEAGLFAWSTRALHDRHMDVGSKRSFFLPLNSSSVTGTNIESVYVSLTTIPSRLSSLRQTIESILHQTVLATTLLIFLPEMPLREEGKSYEIPQWLNDMVSSQPVLVVRIPIDYGPATKFIGPVQYLLKRSLEHSPVIVIDDDVIYPDKIVETLLQWHQRLPHAVVAAKGWVVHVLNRYITPPKAYGVYGNELDAPHPVTIVNGNCGYLIVPSMFVPKSGVYDKNNLPLWDFTGVKKAVQFMDDIWISGNLAKLGVPRFVVPFDRDQVNHAALIIEETINLDIIEGISGMGARTVANNMALEHFKENWDNRFSDDHILLLDARP